MVQLTVLFGLIGIAAALPHAESNYRDLCKIEAPLVRLLKGLPAATPYCQSLLHVTPRTVTAIKTATVPPKTVSETVIHTVTNRRKTITTTISTLISHITSTVTDSLTSTTTQEVDLIAIETSVATLVNSVTNTISNFHTVTVNIPFTTTETDISTILTTTTTTQAATTILARVKRDDDGRPKALKYYPWQKICDVCSCLDVPCPTTTVHKTVTLPQSTVS
jgi:hypothetical protein